MGAAEDGPWQEALQFREEQKEKWLHGPFILHYVNCGFPFWLDKFVLLGKFHDGYMRKFTIPWDSMRGSRDVVLANAKGRKGRRGVVDAGAPRHHAALAKGTLGAARL